MTRKEKVKQYFINSCEKYVDYDISIVVGKTLLMREKNFFVTAILTKGWSPNGYYRNDIETFQSFSEAWKSFESRADFRKKIL